MSEVAKNVSSFIRESVARIKGDTAEATAAKNERIARAAFKQQVSGYESKVVGFESNVETAQEAFNAALFPAEGIKDQQRYVDAVVGAHTNLKNAEAALEQAQKSQVFFEDLLNKKF